MRRGPGYLTTPIAYLHDAVAMTAYVRQANRRTRLRLVVQRQNGAQEEFHARFGSTLWRAVLLPMFQLYAARHAFALKIYDTSDSLTSTEAD